MVVSAGSKRLRTVSAEAKYGGQSLQEAKISSLYPVVNILFQDVVVVVLLFYVHGKHLRSCRDGQLT